jgi:hypothetical protein
VTHTRHLYSIYTAFGSTFIFVVVTKITLVHGTAFCSLCRDPSLARTEFWAKEMTLSIQEAAMATRAKMLIAALMAAA